MDIRSLDIFCEKYCEAKVLAPGFLPFGNCNEWRSCYYHPILKTILIVYVDDMIVSGPCSGADKTWKLLRGDKDKITMDDPPPAFQFLGCDYQLGEVFKKGRKVKTVTQDMDNFLVQCVGTWEQCVAECGGGKWITKKFLHPLLRKMIFPMLHAAQLLVTAV